MDWTILADGEVAAGRAHVYLVTAGAPGARLCRWSNSLNGYRPMDLAREVARTVIIFPLGRGPGRPAAEPELDAAVAALKVYAERFEAGESLDGFPAWQQQPALEVHDGEFVRLIGDPPEAFVLHGTITGRLREPRVPEPRWEDLSDETRAFFDALHGGNLSEGL